jgi:kexin
VKNSIFVKYFLLSISVVILAAVLLVSCSSSDDSSDSGGGGGGGGEITIPTADDNDGDYIPNNIEAFLGLDANNSDENNNGIIDGLDTGGVYGDTFFDMQWHIRNLGIATNDSGVLPVAGNDLDVLETYHSYMGYNDGTNIIVQVVDTGVDSIHEDLDLDLTRSYDGEDVGDPSANEADGEHGTMVAGIMAATAFNGKGVRGVIPFAKIAGSNWLESQTYVGLEKAWYSGAGANEIAVSNNSWGSYSSNNTVYEDLMQLGTSDLRDGKGRIYVGCAGNGREQMHNANLRYMVNNRYPVTVAALKADNTHADYSSPGSNILVSGYSGNYYQDSPTIGTTTITGTSSNTGDINTKTTWSADSSGNYTYAMNGTSAAAPTVAASIALVLEACPDLTWRDVKHLTVAHAKPIDTGNGSWVTNGVGLKHSTDYGFGLINAKDMIAECTSTYTNLAAETYTSVSIAPNSLIPDNSVMQTFNINVPTNFTIEWVEVTVDNDGWGSDYRVELTSPSGTKTTLMTEKTLLEGAWMNGGFRLGTAAMTGESSAGTWVLGMADEWALYDGTLKDVTIKIYGH